MPPQQKKTYALFFVEGHTEIEFYKPIIAQRFQGLPKSIYNLEGAYNIHKNTYGLTLDFLRKHPDSNVRVFCCLDRESRFNAPPLNLKEMRDRFASDPKYEGRVLSADSIIATIMIESWFFHDIENIYKFLRAPKSKRNSKKFNPPERFTHKDLSALFKQFGKLYIKGEKCSGLINALDLNLIYANCSELRNGLDKVKSKLKL